MCSTIFFCLAGNTVITIDNAVFLLVCSNSCLKVWNLNQCQENCPTLPDGFPKGLPAGHKTSVQPASRATDN